jgi:hypothetical protein
MSCQKSLARTGSAANHTDLPQVTLCGLPRRCGSEIGRRGERVCGSWSVDFGFWILVGRDGEERNWHWNSQFEQWDLTWGNGHSQSMAVSRLFASTFTRTNSCGEVIPWFNAKCETRGEAHNASARTSTHGAICRGYGDWCGFRWVFIQSC